MPHPLTAARIGELLRLQIILEQPDLTLFDVRLYVAERLNDLYPLNYHVILNWRYPSGDRCAILISRSAAPLVSAACGSSGQRRRRR